MKVAAIIQARMTSTRFPGKVLKPLAGKPVIWHIFHRLRKCKTLDHIVLATSTNSEDDPLAAFAKREGITVVRGPEDDVLKRYYLAAKKVRAEIIVRVTGDAPLIDPPWLDYMVEVLISQKTDRVGRVTSVPCAHEGFSPFTFSALERLVREVGEDPVAKEHVTGYFSKDPDFATASLVTPEKDCQFDGARLSVDTPADLLFMEEVYRQLNVPAGEADIRDVIELLKVQPELLSINTHVRQKKAEETTRIIMFRCDADEKIGFGHLYRCIALAEEFRQSYGCGITFTVASGEVAKTKLQEEGFAVIEVEKEKHTESLDAVINKVKPNAIVFDCLLDLDKNKIEHWRNSGILTVSIDDPTEKKYHVDLLFYPPVPQVDLIDKNRLTGNLYSGWEWVVLRKQFANVDKQKKKGQEKPVLLITMGGSDPQNLTKTCIEALFDIKQKLKVEILLGPGYIYHREIEDLLVKFPHEYNININFTEPVELFKSADLAIASFGVTAYELAACGTPSLLLSITEDHATSASAFEKAGMAINLGCIDNLKPDDLRQALKDFISADKNINEATQLEKALNDGTGARRIAAITMERLY